jgi:flagellar biosynthesis/type III secretory pathway chaperone
MELDKEVKQVELNDTRNVLDEKLKEISSLTEEKMSLLAKFVEMKRDRQEQQSIIHVSRKQSSQEDGKPCSRITTNIDENQDVSQILTFAADFQ